MPYWRPSRDKLTRSIEYLQDRGQRIRPHQARTDDGLMEKPGQIPRGAKDTGVKVTGEHIAPNNVQK